MEKAAEAGLTSITADEVRNLNHELEDAHRKIEAEQIYKDLTTGKLLNQDASTAGLIETIKSRSL